MPDTENISLFLYVTTKIPGVVDTPTRAWRQKLCCELFITPQLRRCTDNKDNLYKLLSAVNTYVSRGDSLVCLHHHKSTQRRRPTTMASMAKREAERQAILTDNNPPVPSLSTQVQYRAYALLLLWVCWRDIASTNHGSNLEISIE